MFSILWKAINDAETTKKVTTENVMIGSILPWPYGWFLSAGFWEYFKPKKTRIELNISAVDSIPSAIKA